MKRYFFDVVSAAGREYDYRGLTFSNANDAADAAEVIALDRTVRLLPDEENCAVEVRDLDGRLLFAISRDRTTLAAA